MQTFIIFMTNISCDFNILIMEHIIIDEYRLIKYKNLI